MDREELLGKVLVMWEELWGPKVPITASNEERDRMKLTFISGAATALAILTGEEGSLRREITSSEDQTEPPGDPHPPRGTH
jgi:hypothetical protein